MPPGHTPPVCAHPLDARVAVLVTGTFCCALSDQLLWCQLSVSLLSRPFAHAPLRSSLSSSVYLCAFSAWALNCRLSPSWPFSPFADPCLCSRGILKLESKSRVKVARALPGTFTISTARWVDKVDMKGELPPGCSVQSREQRTGLTNRPT